MDNLLSLIGLSPPRDLLDLNKEELVKIIQHVMMWLDRGPFAQQKSGFDKMIELTKDPLLIDYFRLKLSEGKSTLRFGFILQEYTIILDPELATIIFRNSIPLFPHAKIEENLIGDLAPLQTTLSIGHLWQKRRCLSEHTLDWTPLNSIISLQSIAQTEQHILPPFCPVQKFTTSSMVIPIINKWFERCGLPTKDFETLDNLTMIIVFGSHEYTETMSLYMKQAQSLGSALNSNEVPFPELRQWYRNYLREIVSHPPSESLAARFVEVAIKLKHEYTSQEIEDQLPVAFFQISSIFKIFLPIALAIGFLHPDSSAHLSQTTYDMIFTNNNYLHFFVMEIIRLYNQVFILQRQVSQDLNIGNLNLKAGDQINLLFAFYMRDPNIYPRPDSFFPLRWINESHIRWDLGQHPFSSGSQTCPARNLALHIAKFLIYRLFTDPNYKYSLINKLHLDFDNMPQIINPYCLQFQLLSR